MGRGDKRTKRGKIFRGSFGKSRPQNPPAAATDAKKIVKAEVKVETAAPKA